MLQVIKTEKINGLRRKALGLNLNGEDLPVSKFPQRPKVREYEGGFVVSSYNLNITNRIKLLAANEFPQITELDLFWAYLDDFRLYIEIQFSKKELVLDKEEVINAILNFKIYADLHKWKRNFSFNEYRKRFNRNLHSSSKNLDFSISQTENDSEESLFIELSISHKFSNSSISDELFKYEEVLLQYLRQTIAELKIEISENLIVASFNFPDELKFSCEQYLLYFAKFLQDLGINATSSLKEEAGKVLFSVTPTDDVEALDKIRKALAVYLTLPSSPIVYDESFAALRLKQQIDLLKHSQQMAETEFRLRMAQNLVEAQHKTIEDQSGMIVQQATFIQQQKEHIERITNPAVMINSAENKEELEELYDGVKVGESETLKKWLGISLNPAKAIKTAVKNTIGKHDEKKSILGLDNEEN